MAKHLFFLFFFCSSSFVLKADAQLFKRKQAKPSEKPPKAVFVELFSGARRIARVKDEVMKKEISEAMQSFNEKIIMDFEDNFKYCAVYYFYDTNIINIQKGLFEGLLIDADGKLIQQPILANGDTNFYILYYGVLVPTSATPFDEHVAKKMLVALDHNGDLLLPPLPRTPPPASFKNIKSKKFNYFYKYSNRETDTYYRACALRYSKSLQKYFGRNPYKQKK